jgi:hypothetical protein
VVLGPGSRATPAGCDRPVHANFTGGIRDPAAVQVGEVHGDRAGSGRSFTVTPVLRHGHAALAFAACAGPATMAPAVAPATPVAGHAQETLRDPSGERIIVVTTPIYARRAARQSASGPGMGRAEAVCDRLVGLGVDPTRLELRTVSVTVRAWLDVE